MVAKQIDDIRVLRSRDPRIMRQMADLSRYVTVSTQPTTKRVLSYSTSSDKKEEDVCEEIRDSLGPNGVYLERVDYSEVSYADLPEKARDNLGIRPDQKNVVATLTLRSLEGSLAKEMVNAWMVVLYKKLNQGSKGYM
jgi:phenylalanyl-tRNA synthetase alpha chain